MDNFSALPPVSVTPERGGCVEITSCTYHTSEIHSSLCYHVSRETSLSNELTDTAHSAAPWAYLRYVPIVPYITAVRIEFDLRFSFGLPEPCDPFDELFHCFFL